MWARAVIAVACAVALAACGAIPYQVKASVETDPVHHGGDAADDPCVWIHPTDPALSLVIADDKQGGLLVYGLDGGERQWLDQHLRLNNVDLRYGFSLAGGFASGAPHASVDLIAVGDESGDGLRFYKVDPATRAVEAIGGLATGQAEPYGGCLYHSAVDGRFHAFVTYRSGWVEQWRLVDAGDGSVAATKERQFDVGSQVEGCVADDQAGVLYIGEETVAIWRYGAEPGHGAARDLVARPPAFLPDVEGLALHRRADGSGYLIASSQGDDTFRVFDRRFTAGAVNAYLGAFAIDRGPVDGVSGTDGVEVVSLGLGPAFPAGLLVVHDDRNGLPGNSGNQNFKLVPWERVANAFSPPLAIGGAEDPRAPAAPVVKH